MKRLFSIEWKKYSLSKKNIILLLLAGFLVFIFIYFHYSLEQHERSRLSENNKHLAQNLQEEHIPDLKLKLKDDKKKESGKEHIRKLIDLFERQTVIYENLASAFNENDSEKILKYELEESNIAIYSHKARLLHGQPIKRLNEQSTYFQYLYDHKIYMPDSFSQMNGTYMLYRFMINIFPILLPAIALFVTFSTISNEKSQGTLKFLLQQPYKRRKILLSKLSVSGLISFLILGTVCLFQFAMTSIVGGMGYTQYPVKVSAAIPNSFLIGDQTYVPLSTFLVYALGIICIGIIFYTVLATLISVVSPNNITSFLLSVVVLSASIMLRNNNISSPYVISDINSILGNKFIIIPIVFYLLISILLIILSLFIFKRKNIYS